MAKSMAVQLGVGIEPYHPFFFEDPVMPDNFGETVYVAARINIPIATGERYTSLWEFEMALSRNTVR
jgi:galactonate dehydratase